MSDEQLLNPNAGTDPSVCPDVKSAIEALLFVSEKPLSPQQIKIAFKDLEADKIKEVSCWSLKAIMKTAPAACALKRWPEDSRWLLL